MPGQRAACMSHGIHSVTSEGEAGWSEQEAHSTKHRDISYVSRPEAEHNAKIYVIELGMSRHKKLQNGTAF